MDYLWQPCFRIAYMFYSAGETLFLYIGYTTNLPNRIEKHNSGGVLSTAPRRPLKLIFCEYYLFEEDARQRELYFKTTMGKKAIKLMLSESLKRLGYKGSLSAKTLTIIHD